MKYIVGTPHKHRNRVYLYNHKTNKIHIYGEYKDYLIDNDINYLNIAVENNRVYFIPCFPSEYDQTNRSVKLSEVKPRKSISFNSKKLFEYFRIVIKKSTKENTESEGHNLNYTQINIDKHRKGIYFEIPEEITNRLIYIEKTIKKCLKNKTTENMKTNDLVDLTKTFISECPTEMNEIINEIYPEIEKIKDTTLQAIMNVICTYHLDYLLNMKINNGAIEQK
jgi:hypothetical protein